MVAVLGLMMITLPWIYLLFRQLFLKVAFSINHLRDVNRFRYVLFAFIILINPVNAKAPSVNSVRLAGANYIANAPTSLAKERGYFRDQEIDITIIDTPSGKEALRALRRGEAEFALMTATPLVLDRLNDINPGEANDPVILANLVNSVGLMQVVARSKTGIIAPKQFEGRRVALDPGTSAEFIWWLFSRYHGIDVSKVELVHLDGEGMYRALVERQIDGAVLWEPWITRVDEKLREDERRVLTVFGVEQMYSGKWLLVSTREILSQHPDLPRRVISALRAAIDFMKRNPAESRKIHQKHFGLSSNFLIETWDELDYDLSLDWTLIAALQQQFIWATQNGYKNIGPPIHILELIDDRVLREHWPITVGIPSSEHGDEP